MDCLSSPLFVKSYKDEMDANLFQLYSLINGDANLAQLLILLVIFSPVSLTLSNEETHQLKYFQEKSSMLLYKYLMSK